MARITVTTDHGLLVHAERVSADDFATEHFRSQLAQRLAWAADDAEALEDAAAEPVMAEPDRLVRPLALA